MLEDQSRIVFGFVCLVLITIILVGCNKETTLSQQDKRTISPATETVAIKTESSTIAVQMLTAIPREVVAQKVQVNAGFCSYTEQLAPPFPNLKGIIFNRVRPTYWALLNEVGDSDLRIDGYVTSVSPSKQQIVYDNIQSDDLTTVNLFVFDLSTGKSSPIVADSNLSSNMHWIDSNNLFIQAMTGTSEYVGTDWFFTTLSQEPEGNFVLKNQGKLTMNTEGYAKVSEFGPAMLGGVMGYPQPILFDPLGEYMTYPCYHCEYPRLITRDLKTNQERWSFEQINSDSFRMAFPYWLPDGSGMVIVGGASANELYFFSREGVLLDHLQFPENLAFLLPHIKFSFDYRYLVMEGMRWEEADPYPLRVLFDRQTKLAYDLCLGNIDSSSSGAWSPVANLFAISDSKTSEIVLFDVERTVQYRYSNFDHEDFGWIVDWVELP